MYRWFLLPILLVLMIVPVAAQVRTTSVDLGDGQSATIIPLYRNFDFFYDSIVNGSGGDFSECAEAWPRMNEAFGVEIPSDPHFQYVRRWDITSDQIRDQVLDVIGDTLKESADLLPGIDIQVCVVPAPPEGSNWQMANNALYGVASNDVIIVALGGLTGNWRVRVESVIAHEYHHTVRSTSANRDLVEDEVDDDDITLSLLERVVSEGMAVVFAQMVVPEFDDPVYGGLTAEQEAVLWAAMSPEFQSGNNGVQNYFLLGGRDGVPLNAGYTIGYNMMLNFIANNPDVSLEEWTMMSGVEVYEASGYNPEN